MSRRFVRVYRRKKKQQQQQSFYLSTTSLKTNMAGGIGQWYWNAAPNPFGKDQPAQWIAYSSNDNKTIEDSFIKNATKVELENHCIYFHEQACALECQKLERLEIQWDEETLRWNENSSKFIDHIRIRCTKLQSLVLADGEYYELVRSNFERADRQRVVRTTTTDQTSIVSLLNYYNELRFN
ncbi:unnamed protein product [Rotaria socialis]